MIYQVNIMVPKRKETEIEEILYALVFQGWETLDEKDFTIFRIYLKEEEFRGSLLKDLEKFLAKHLDVKVEYVIVEEKNWVEIWRESFKPVEIGETLLIIPPWIDASKFREKKVIIIEPGQAFGTGHHPTTQMMLENIELLAKKLTSCEKCTILDLGCGTGILAIACAKLIPNAEIWAVDIDEEAIKATHLNATLNQVKDKIIITDKIPNLKFDTILANLGYKELKNLSLQIKELSKKEKTDLFLSGILNEDAEEIKNIYEKLGYKLIKIKTENEWTFLWFKLE